MLRSRFAGAGGQRGTGSNPLGSHDVDDLIQEVFVRVLATGAITRFDAGQSPLPYLVRAAHNLAIDVLRGRRRHSVGLDGATTFATNALSVAGSLSPEGAAELERRRHEGRLEQLCEYIAELPHELAVMYEARFVRGLSQRDTADFLGVTRRRVRTLEERLLAGAASVLTPGAAKDGAKRAAPERRAAELSPPHARLGANDVGTRGVRHWVRRAAHGPSPLESPAAPARVA